jgi:hypothetical protein
VGEGESYSTKDYWDVSVVTRAAPQFKTLESPDGHFKVSVWTYIDPRGLRASARLVRDPRGAGGEFWINEGSWSIEPVWLGVTRLELRIKLLDGATLPSIPRKWSEIELVVTQT